MANSELITRCLDDILEGKTSLEDCLKRHPELGEELPSLLSAAGSVWQKRAAISPAFKLEARHRLFSREGVARGSRKTGGFRWLSPLTLANGLRVPLAALLVALGLVGSGAGVVYASQSSLPGEVLYPVKLGSENVRLAFTLSPEAKARLDLALAQRRVEEAVTQSERGEDVSDTTPGAVARHLDAAIKEIESLDEAKSGPLISELSELTIKQQATLNRLIAESPEERRAALEETIDASRRGSTVAVAADANPDFLDSRPSVADEKLEQYHFTLEGFLQSAGEDWNIGGIIIQSVSVPRGAVYITGGRVSIEGIIRDGKTFVSSIKQKEGTGAEVSILGVFSGTSPDGSIWYISGIPIGQPHGLSPVAEGTKLNLTGTVQNGSLVVTGQASGDNEPKRDVKIAGKLVEVSSDSSTVVIEVAGAKITANIAQAEIQAEGAPGFQKSDLRSIIGKEIKVSGLKSQDGTIYARKVFIAGDGREHSPGDTPGSRSSDRENSHGSGTGQKKPD